MDKVKNYNEGSEDCMYRGVESTYGKRVEQEMKMQPKFAEPEAANGKNQKSRDSSAQVGP